MRTEPDPDALAPPPASTGSAFPTTHWSVVLRAGERVEGVASEGKGFVVRTARGDLAAPDPLSDPPLLVALPLLDPGRPVDDQRRRDPALVHPRLVQPEG